ncbi:putative 3-octaprenyl-4-hydroxybenzoate carboxy-lyase [Ilyonectria robusta]|uniref:putative 3-octaprenyl-4-hydroxybenzoate carboxy-lyase n=1 Tax=Ilyonectria robusta TaxID=1079257 RepID=UPI001E8D3384|nr:putative 3-octaprenyl-4-hydroxybenzoate carboxy-lyase [Ilyonectria robusta]KAH8665332.1 putative 3-octaprenyl-4-hydroxybenzoate carboxy-lyase [Ilyonectria robusta]
MAVQTLSVRQKSTLELQQQEIAAQLDFRTFVDVLRQDNDLAEINQEIDPHLEVGAIVRRVSEVSGKAPLFNNVKGARNGLWRMFGNAASLRASEEEKYGRIARNLGLPPNSSWKAILERTQSAKNKPLLQPNVLANGPCKQNKIFGDDIDLNKLPAPLLHQGDGGKYLQTYGVHVLQSPDKSWTNWSIFRGMIHDKRRLVCLVGTGQHNSIIRDKWLKEGKDEMPWALALGIPPAASLAAALPIPEGVSEAEYVGAMVGKPLDLVKCELSDLLVPANSEIVLEGTFSLKDKALEGPFEDYLGLHFDGDRHMHPLFTVNAITYRDDPILPVSVPGRITDESHVTASMASAELLTLCKNHDLPINDAVAPLETMANWCALQVDTKKLTSLKTNSKDFCSKLGQIVYNNKSSMLFNRILLFGEDVDIYNFKDVMWALVTRCRPGQDEYVFEDVPSFPMTPYMSHGTGTVKTGGKAISDCLFPMEYEGRKTFSSVDFETSYPEEVKSKVRANWTAMGFDVV